MPTLQQKYDMIRIQEMDNRAKNRELEARLEAAEVEIERLENGQGAVIGQKKVKIFHGFTFDPCAIDIERNDEVGEVVATLFIKDDPQVLLECIDSVWVNVHRGESKLRMNRQLQSGVK